MLTGKRLCTVQRYDCIKRGDKSYDTYIHVLMMCRKIELILIKIEFFMNFQRCPKIGQKTLYYSTESMAKFHQN